MLRVKAGLPDATTRRMRILSTGAESIEGRDPEEIFQETFRAGFRVEEAHWLWVDLDVWEERELAWVLRRFELPSEVEADIRRDDLRPRALEAGGGVFLSLHALRAATGQGSLDTVEVHAYLRGKTLITVRRERLPAIDRWAERLRNGATVAPRAADALLARVAEKIAAPAPEALSAIEQAIDELDDHADLGWNRTHARGFRAHLTRLRSLRSELAMARRVLAPGRSALEEWQELAEQAGGSGPEGVPLTREARAALSRAAGGVSAGLAQIEELRERARAIQDTIFALMSARTNETMRRLTLLSVLFLPLTFLTGFFGMNFEMIPWGSHALFGVALSSILALPLGMLAWLRRQG